MAPFSAVLFPRGWNVLNRKKIEVLELLLLEIALRAIFFLLDPDWGAVASPCHRFLPSSEEHGL